MRYGIVMLIALSLFFAIDYQAVASDGDFAPLWGVAVHTVWDEEEGDYGNTYGYVATPTNYGRFTSIVVDADYSTMLFVCYYDNETDSADMAVRFGLDIGLPFSQDVLSLNVTIGEYEPVEVTLFRRESDEAIIEAPVSGFDKSRASETFAIDIGPFKFDHNIEGLFDVPVARNLIWCDDREVEPYPTPESE